MTIYGYKVGTDNNHIHKELTGETEYNGTPKGEIAVENLTLLIDDNVTDLNYFYIPDFKRYYYVTGRNIIRNGLTEVSLHVDVLMSFVDDIMQMRIFATRTNKQPSDGEQYPKGVSWDASSCSLPCLQQTYTNVIKFGNIPIRPYFYLVTVG